MSISSATDRLPCVSLHVCTIFCPTDCTSNTSALKVYIYKLMPTLVNKWRTVHKHIFYLLIVAVMRALDMT